MSGEDLYLVSSLEIFCMRLYEVTNLNYKCRNLAGEISQEYSKRQVELLPKDCRKMLVARKKF